MERTSPAHGLSGRRDGRIVHPLDPVFDKKSRVLVLGTMPSPRSRAEGFYYMHPGNRFWPVLAEVFDPGAAAAGRVPQTVSERRAFALSHGIALWDVLASCVIEGAEDVSIREPVVNDFSLLLRAAPISLIATTGQTAHRLYTRLCLPRTGRDALCLPSPSGANRRVPFADLVAAYRCSCRAGWIVGYCRYRRPSEPDTALSIRSSATGAERFIDFTGGRIWTLNFTFHRMCITAAGAVAAPARSPAGRG
jgi:hypoxanthine-DNA glycosylase